MLINLLSQTFIQPLHIHLPNHLASHTTLQKSANPCSHLFLYLTFSYPFTPLSPRTLPFKRTSNANGAGIKCRVW